MNFVGTILSGIASPLIEFYGESRKWKIAEETARCVTQGVGSRVDRVLDATGSLTRHSYVRLENGVSQYLEESGQYLKLFGTACSMQVLSSVIHFSGQLVGCSANSNRHCALLEYSALGSSAYACFAATVLGYKAAVSFYRYFKTIPPVRAGSPRVNVLAINRRPHAGVSGSRFNSSIAERESGVVASTEQNEVLPEHPDRLRVDVDAARESARNAARSARIAIEKLKRTGDSSIDRVDSTSLAESVERLEPSLEIAPVDANLQAARSAARESAKKLKRVLKKL